ncbi:alpha-2-macroglobulin family protein [Urechidicola croceus]|uniref:Alpha-2-macroglobulin n=1 Tax=Urechidicola croceus TaxID=1850246 RepID=A0A1D8PB25_9FLAO|nr:MG2 domain-containing protein [Urechidicola croceus]AOW21768.1 alpha-2-macroglobulin [Urechidicola croceus]
MKKVFTSLLIFMMISQSSNAQNGYDNYINDWAKVYKFELDALPKSALAEVEKIYSKAKKENNAPQLIKTLIYKSKFALILEEDAQLKVINDLKTEIAQSSYPTKNILESVLADIYWQYFQQNRWKFYNRTKTAEKVDKTDFRTWDLQTIFEETDQHYQNSLLNSLELQQTGLTQFNDILNLQLKSKEYRPTLYDFLAFRAIDFYKNEERNLTRPSYKFEIENTLLLGTNKQFISSDISSKDSLSQHLNALKIYKNLALFHLRDKNPTALVDVTLNRLSFVNANAIFENKDSIYLNTLQQLKETHKNHEASTEIDFEIAKLFYEQGNQYNSKENEENRFKFKDALEVIENAISQFPKSIGAKKCANLKAQILKENISITAEKHVPINTPSRLLVNYKNIEKLYFSAYKISKSQQEQLNKIYNDSAKVEFIKKLSKVKEWNSSLRNENDYQQHTTEVLLPQLSQGNYLIFTTTENKTITADKIFATSFIQVTDLALIETNSNGNYTYQVVNRNTGKPIAKAKVNLKNYNTGRYNKPINKNFTTDKNGQFSFKSRNRYRNVVATVVYKDETAIFGDYYLNEYYKNEYKEEDDEITIKPFVFTDRSIYRPGQTVHFKAIVLKKQGEKTELFTNEYVEIYLYNPNDEIVKTLDLKLNEYGSVSGEFILPSSGLTGSYSLNVDESSEYDSKFYDNVDFYFEDEYHEFSVEEYKRPKFETEFKPVTETYKLNDSITVNGNAIAFAGSNISDAKVVYRVVRTAIFPRWYNWYSRPSFSSDELEITNGETTTDADGNYEIIFKAIPDLKISKESQPTFNYKVFADVTDINGETRSTETIVKVGYHALVATAAINSKIDKTDKDHKISITTNNLNGEFVPTKGTIKIYKLKSPKNPLRVRPWNAPDYQDFSEEEFRNLFPHDAYTDDENNEENWKKGKLVYDKKFDTEKSKKIELGNIKKWNSGKYIVVIECKDKFNQEVKDEQRFDVYSNKDKQVADNKLFFINTNKSTYKPNETVELQVGSASNDVTVTVTVEKNHEIVSTHFVHLDNETKTIKIPVNNEDIGGFAVKYHFVNYNSFNAGKVDVFVPYSSDNLNIETLTFRDKLQPGSEQTWSFKIKGDKNDKVAAELLASMYDASLDEFKSHNWTFNPITRYQYSSYGLSSSHNSFGTNNFRIHNQHSGYYSFPQKGYDALNWFGFSFNNQRWVNRQYLAKVEREYRDTRTDYDKIITGTVTDESGPLPGVNVGITGTTFGTVTDFDGNYSIKVKSGDILHFSFIGFHTIEHTVNKFSTINIELEADEESLDEVVVVGYGTTEKRSITGAVSMVQMEVAEEDSEVGRILEGKVAGVSIENDDKNVRLRGASSISGMNNPLYVVDGVIVENFNVEGSNITDISILKDASATALYGSRGANGVVIITTKSGQAKIDAELSKVQARKNLQETAFFFPHLRTDKDGNVSFDFTVPEALTRWKLQLLAHTKDLKTATKTLSTVTQKELMVLPNPPRFLREGDKIIFSSKISNLTEKALNGFAQLQLIDATTGKAIDELLGNVAKSQSFELDAKGNTNVNWSLTIPENIQAVQYKIVAKAGDFSDGEQNALPVLSNRMLVTETLPMWIKSNETKTFTLDKLKNNNSTTLSNHKLTLEVTSNPAWYAVQALPYLMEYPYECSEQTFARYYANSLATHIANSNPRIQEVFNQWASTDALLSNLEKNQELKSLIIQETPWLRDAQSETEQKKRIALLFDLNKMKNELDNALRKLDQMQMSNGGFPWFKGSRYPNRYITQHIASGFGHLNKLGVQSNDKSIKMIQKAVQFLDDEIEEDYAKLLESAAKIREQAKTKTQGLKDEKEYLEKKHLGHFQLQYLYMRSFYGDISMNDKVKTAVAYYKKQSAEYWKEFNLYSKGMIALVQHRNGEKSVATQILKSLEENSITNEELGMYWKENTASWYWYQAPIETQALMIEVFSEIPLVISTEPESATRNLKKIDNLKVWLLKNKQTNRWKTTKATTEAVYALLLQGTNWLEAGTERSRSVTDFMDVKIGNEIINPLVLEETKVEAGTGYFKTSFYRDEIKPEMATVTLTKDTEGIAWGALYWQYFENLDKITSAETPLKLAKKLFLKQHTDKGEEISEITDATELKLGDLVRVRIELRSDRDMEFVHMKDMRASGFEPINVLSEYKYQDSLGYYESTKDASTNFFFDRLPKGVYVFEYDLRVNNKGDFSNGITTIQSMYAPEFSSHSEGVRVKID